jgi:N utilization substance protein A
MQAIKQICEEKNLSYESVLETVESAMASAYRKDFGEKNQNLKAEFDPETGALRVFDIKTVVTDELFAEYEKEMEERAKLREQMEAEGLMVPPAREEREEIVPVEGEEEKPRFSPKLNISLSEAKKIKKSAKLDEVLKTELEVPGEFGRMAAQTAKQVITQRLREAERENIFADFKDKEHQLLVGVVQRREGRVVLVDLGKTTAVIPPEGQVPTERYNSGDRLKVYVESVAIGTRGPEITISRAHPELVRKLFSTEIPEISEGIVEINSVAREAGSRTKIAVSSKEQNVDPVGSCIGQRGTRIQTIINEIGGEKIDIVEYSENMEKFITNALSPAKIQNIKLNEETKLATAYVASDQLSLAIGRGGQNVRLAARLTGWTITIEEIKTAVSADPSSEALAKAETPAEEGVTLEEEKISETPTETPVEASTEAPTESPIKPKKKSKTAKASESATETSTTEIAATETSPEEEKTDKIEETKE